METDTIRQRFAEPSGCVNHCCKPDRRPWMSTVHQHPTARICAAFFPNTERSTPKVDY